MDAIADVGAAIPFDRYALRAGLGVSMVNAMRLEMGPVATLSMSESSRNQDRRWSAVQARQPVPIPRTRRSARCPACATRS
jgi:hypothetical protein